MENPITKKGNIATISEISTMIESQAIPLISIGGIPGAGKSYNAALLNKSLQNSIVVPMDGFHLYRRELSAEGIKYRGVVFTFDLEKFAKKMR